MEIKITYEKSRPIESANFIATGSAKVTIHVNEDRVEFKVQNCYMSYNKEDFNEFTELMNRINEQLKEE